MFNKFINNVNKLKLGITILAGSLFLSACGGGKWGFPYKLDVQQGNWITASQVEQLEEGMSRDQVQYLLGTPVLQNVFRNDRWDYPYYTKPGYGETKQRTFTVWFEDDYLVKWAGDNQPSRQPFEKADSGTDSITNDGNIITNVKDQATPETFGHNDNLDAIETFGLENDQEDLNDQDTKDQLDTNQEDLLDLDTNQENLTE